MLAAVLCRDDDFFHEAHEPVGVPAEGGKHRQRVGPRENKAADQVASTAYTCGETAEIPLRFVPMDLKPCSMRFLMLYLVRMSMIPK